MVSRNGDDQPRTSPDQGSEATRWDAFVAKHGGTIVPVALLLAIAALMIYGMFAPR